VGPADREFADPERPGQNDHAQGWAAQAHL